MAYMRGNPYIWGGEDGVHICADMAEVVIDDDTFNALSLMVVAELYQDKKAMKKAIKTALRHRGNFGCIPLCELLKERNAMDIVKDMIKAQNK